MDNFDDVRAALAWWKWNSDFRYGILDDDSAWYSIGDPVTGPHVQGDIYADEKTLAMIALAHNRLPALMAELDAARAEAARLKQEVDSVRNVSARWLLDRDAEQRRIGAAEVYEHWAPIIGPVFADEFRNRAAYLWQKVGA